MGVCVCPDVLKEVRQGQHDLGEVESKYAKGQVVCEAELWEMSEEGLSVEKRDWDISVSVWTFLNLFSVHLN